MSSKMDGLALPNVRMIPKPLDPMINVWAIVNNLRAFLPDVKKAGQTLAKYFGVQLKALSLMEALDLCTVGNLDAMLPSTF